MAKKQASTRRTRAASSASTESAELKSAEQRLREAREQLSRAREYYQEVRDRAQQGPASGDPSTGSVVDELLKLVRKYPGAGIATAALVGFLFGRSFKH